MFFPGLKKKFHRLSKDPTVKTILPLILPLYLPSLIFAFSRSLLTPILPLYVGNFDVGYGWVGLVVAGEAIGMLIGDLPSGAIHERLGSKRSMLVGIFIIAVSTCGLFWAGSVTSALIYRLIAGFGTAIFTIARHTFIANTIPSVQRGRSIALMGGIFRIGRFAGPLAGGMAASAYGLRFPFILFGVSFLLALLIVLIFMPGLSQTTSQKTAYNGNNQHSYLKLLKQEYKTLLRAGPGQLFLQMVRSGPQIIIPLYAADILGLSVETIGLIMSISGAIDMTLFYPTGVIMDRFGRKYAILSSSFFMSLGILLIPLTHGLTSLILVGILIGFGNGLGSGAMMTLGADLAPADARSSFLGIWRLIGDGGSTAGPLAIGAVADAVSLPLTASIIAGTGFFAFFTFLFFVKETLDKKSYPLPEPSNQSG